MGYHRLLYYNELQEIFSHHILNVRQAIEECDTAKILNNDIDKLCADLHFVHSVKPIIFDIDGITTEQ